jgi:RND family efflux transporter MFP subunit
MKRWSTPQRVIAAVVAVVLLAGAGYLVWQVTRPAPAAQTVPTTTIVKAQKQTMRQTVSASGTIAPQRQSYLNFPAAGTVLAVKVNLGDTVKAGTVLATQDTTSLDAAVTSAEAAANSAQSTLNTLLDTSTSTSEQIAAARAQLASAEAKLVSARNDQAGAVMTSPIDGVVAQVNLTANTKVTGSASITTGAGTSTTISTSTANSAQMVVVDPTSWQLNATVGMADLSVLKQGMTATVLPTGSAAPVPATLNAVGLVGSSTSGQATFPITLLITGNPAGMYIGGTADATITVSSIEALTIPTAAISIENGQPTVKVMKSGVETATTVKLGRTFGNLTEITDGVVEGDEIVVPIAAMQQNRTVGARPSGAPRSGASFPGGGGSGRPSAPQTSR